MLESSPAVRELAAVCDRLDDIQDEFVALSARRTELLRQAHAEGVRTIDLMALAGLSRSHVSMLIRGSRASTVRLIKRRDDAPPRRKP